MINRYAFKPKGRLTAMTPASQHRTRSLRAFKLSLCSGAAALIILIGLPSPGFSGTTVAYTPYLIILSLCLLLLSLIANLTSLVYGIKAWKNGAGPCPWLLICGLLLATPIIFLL